MGYPFDRRWRGGDLAKVIREQPSMAARNVTLRNVVA